MPRQQRSIQTSREDSITYLTGSRSTRNWVIGVSENGWTTNELSLAWLKHFNEYIKKKVCMLYLYSAIAGHPGWQCKKGWQRHPGPPAKKGWMGWQDQKAIATPEKYDGNRNDLRTFLTTIDLYCEFNKIPRRIFGEVDAKNQVEKAITRLKQTTSVSAYTAEFKQL
ncbi:hypothetical protein yc1106_02106 [Curvularia clavata]|uniref:Retrotransposon gag domain-containing protein n=1 Tax=Curvularia clavata TaxID=95742 RepID=A0A9Q8Z282_CURCL|nr:hypothetical protein yc1106_02106 [Curvularia clavata]